RLPQLTAFFTSAPILASSAAVNSFSAKATGHMVPSSRFALSLKPNVAYLALNLWALWKKQTTLPSLADAGIPYQVRGERAGPLAVMMAWSRSAMARSGFGISAIFASTSLSPSALSAFSSWARSFIAARSSSVNPLTALADFRVSVFGLIEPPSSTHSSALEDAQSRAQQPRCLRRAGLEALRYRTQGLRNMTPSPRRSRILQCVGAQSCPLSLQRARRPARGRRTWL